MNTLNILHTVVVEPTKYIDLCEVNGQLVTFLMHKVAEPNFYGVLKEEMGNTVETIYSNNNVASS